MPKVWISAVRRITVRTPLFLFNFNSQKVFGLFEATSPGAEDIVPEAWGGRFPAQVRFKKAKSLPSIDANALKNIVDFPKGRPFPILSSDQLMRLLDIFEGKGKMNATQIEGVRYKTADGHVVRSRGEVIIDDALYMHNVAHAYERTIVVGGIEMLPDFFLPEHGVYIEYWGGKSPSYLSHKQSKIGTYAKNNVKLVSLEDEDLSDIDRALAKKLSTYGYRFF